MMLDGRVAVITGAGRGLGRAAAVAMAREGAAMVILSRTADEIRATERMIKEAGGKAIALRGDVSKQEDIDIAVNVALSEFGRIDILMNNAAVIGPVKPLSSVTEAEWERVFGINFKGAVLFSRAVIPVMTMQGGGKIINVTSGLGEMVMPLFGAYSVTKAALIHCTKIGAEELRNRGITVNGLDPGIMDTRMHEEVRALGPGILGEETYREFLHLKESGLLRPPEEVAGLALFLASKDSDGVTGENGTMEYYRRFGYIEPGPFRDRVP